MLQPRYPAHVTGYAFKHIKNLLIGQFRTGGTAKAEGGGSAEGFVNIIAIAKKEAGLSPASAVGVNIGSGRSFPAAGWLDYSGLRAARPFFLLGGPGTAQTAVV